MSHSRMMAEHFGISILESDAKLLHERIQLLIAEAYNRGVQKEREEFAGHAVKIARLAIKEEREACAKECEHTALRMGSEWMAQHCAEAIRARGEA